LRCGDGQIVFHKASFKEAHHIKEMRNSVTKVEMNLKQAEPCGSASKMIKLLFYSDRGRR
jgi:hypothetical protein